jgi:FkbM family methyltransferase
MLQRKVSTALSVLGKDGLRGVARISIEKAGIWWREGEPIDLGKLVGRPVPVARLDGCRFFLDAPEISASLRYLLLSAKHEAPERILAKRWVDPSLPLVELGGSIGVVACVTNRSLHDSTKHVVVEANPKLIALLHRNRALNGCQFTVRHRALAYGDSVVRFPVAEQAISSSVHLPTTEVAIVATTTLSAVLAEHAFGRCSVICDIEGAEMDLVEHEFSVLAARVAMLILEIHPRKVGEEAVARLRYQLRDVGFEEVDRVWDTIALRNTTL